MNIKILFTCLLLNFICFNKTAAQNFGGNPSAIKWKQINSPKARVIFQSGLDSQVNRVANMMQLLADSTSNTIGGKQKKWQVVLQNQTTVPNAYVRLAPIISELYMTPGQDNFSTGSIRWDDNLSIHENRHMQQFSNFNNGLTKLFSFFLGQEGQLLANGIAVPDYFFEGDAVWQETLLTAQGRGRMPNFFNGFKSLWNEKKQYKWMKLRSGSYKDFVPDHYPLGYILVAYGNEKYGADFWKKVTQDATKFKGIFYAFNTAIKKHSGKNYSAFRAEALDYFKQQLLPSKETYQTFNYLFNAKKNNVVDYFAPYFVSADTIVVCKKSYKKIPTFYFVVAGKEIKIRVKDFSLDDYYSYKNGKIIYSAYQSDARFANRNYSVLKLLNVHTTQQKQLTFKNKYFSPDITEDGQEIIAVKVNTNGTNCLSKIDANTGKEIGEVPNKNNYFFTQTKYIDNGNAISAIRTPKGEMALIKINLLNGETENITPFSFNLVGYPFVQGDTVFYTAMNGLQDKIFAVCLSTKKMYKLTHYNNGLYMPSANTSDVLFTAFSAMGTRLAKEKIQNLFWQPVQAEEFIPVNNIAAPIALQTKGHGALQAIPGNVHKVTAYKKTTHFFNYHSGRPFLTDPEYGYQLSSDNVLSSFNNILSYTYNRNDQSHTLGFTGVFAGWYPKISLGAEHNFNRSVDTALGKPLVFNSAKLNATISLPLQFVGGRTFKYFNIGVGYNIEPYLYRGIGKNVFKNKAINYINTFLSFTNTSQKALQNINPRWAQSIAISYRDAFSFRESHKLVASGSFYFPGIAANHSLVFDASFQKRDTLQDLFSNNFSFARGYQALSTRQMIKLGVNYHFPIFYPDFGFGNIIFLQRIRANAFFDYNNSTARVNNVLTNVINRSTGAEIYFDSKVWNALPVSLGIRYSKLLDTDLRNVSAKNRWEIILPINLIPN
jgi:hypothetical protein